MLKLICFQRSIINKFKTGDVMTILILGFILITISSITFYDRPQKSKLIRALYDLC